MERDFSFLAPILLLPPNKGEYHYTLYSRTVKGKTGQILSLLCKIRRKIEKFRDCQSQRLEAFFPRNPNGPRSFLRSKSGGSDGGGQGSLYPPLRMADLLLGQKI